MPCEILVNVEPQERRVAIVEEGKLSEFYIERPQDKTIVGNIYKGKIETVLPSINAAFVDIGLARKGFLYLSEVAEGFDLEVNVAKKNIEVKKDQEVLVQVEKEAFGTKGPRLTTHIGLPGRYLVLMPQDPHLGISRRIDDEAERRRLKQILSELKFPDDIGFIVRTAAAKRSKQDLVRDARFLFKLWQRIKKYAQRQKSPALVYEEYDLALRVIRDSFTDDVAKLIVDSKPEYYRIVRFVKTFLGHLSRRIELYRNVDLFEAKGVEKQIEKVFESVVYLKSKAYIIIEPTEGLVVVDVNSGGFRKRLDPEEAAFRVNLEAAIEIARQVRLRDLGGIIVIDFIDMEKEQHRREVFNTLKREFGLDKAKYDILGISKFGVVEMTRERVHNTVQSLSFDACPYCKGKGRVRSAVTMSIYALKELKKSLKALHRKEVGIYLNPRVCDELLKNRRDIQIVERQFHSKINVLADPNLHIDEIKIV